MFKLLYRVKLKNELTQAHFYTSNTTETEVVNALSIESSTLFAPEH